jgi:hypothetical protein
VCSVDVVIQTKPIINSNTNCNRMLKYNRMIYFFGILVMALCTVMGRHVKYYIFVCTIRMKQLYEWLWWLCEQSYAIMFQMSDFV